MFVGTKVPKGDQVTAGDGLVHLALIKYMFAAKGIDMQVRFGRLLHR